METHANGIRLWTNRISGLDGDRYLPVTEHHSHQVLDNGDIAPIHHSPPASSIAFSSARLLGVRRLPLLRGSSGLPSSSRRAARRTAKSGWDRRRAGSSGFEVLDAMIAETFFLDATVKIGAIEVGVKAEQFACLTEHFIGST